MNKDCVRETMLSLTIEELEHATHNYLQFLEGTKLVPTEPIELDEQAQAKFQANLADSLEQPVHSAEHKLKAITTLDFGPKDTVGPGAVRHGRRRVGGEGSLGGRGCGREAPDTVDDGVQEPDRRVRGVQPAFAAAQGQPAHAHVRGASPGL